MQGLDIHKNEEVIARTDVNPKFWRRQFSGTVTTHQLIYDVALGIVLPILSFIFDPVVFNNNFTLIPFGPELSQYKVLVYLFSALSILTLSAWLMLGNRSGSLSAVVAGILLSGSACSLLIGILILPLSLIGLIVLIGLLGFIPFFTSFVYLRNSVRAFNTAKPLLSRPKLTASLLLGAILIIIPPVFAHRQINRMVAQSMNDLLSGDVRATESATQRLRYFAWAADLDQMVWAYSRETEQTRKETLARAYKDLTGKDIETRLAILLD